MITCTLEGVLPFVADEATKKRNALSAVRSVTVFVPRLSFDIVWSRGVSTGRPGQLVHDAPTRYTALYESHARFGTNLAHPHSLYIDMGTGDLLLVCFRTCGQVAQ
jgi:hypothetical protein